MLLLELPFLLSLSHSLGKLTALLQSIPAPVIGGASIALFGVIAASGLKILVENKVNFDIKRNLLISSVVLVIGIGGMY